MEDALNMNRRRLVLRGIHRRCHAHQLVDCGEELTSPEDSELSDSSHSEPIEGGERMRRGGAFHPFSVVFVDFHGFSWFS